MKKLIVLTITLALIACSNKKAETDMEYGASSEDGGLQVPPTLNTPNYEPALRNTEYRGQVLPKIEGSTIELQGTTRYLLVEDNAENVWDRLINFTASQKLVLSSASPETGVVRTEWMENAAKEKDYLLGGIFNRSTDSTERDRFSFWIERQGDAQTRLYVAHEGQVETVRGISDDPTDAVQRFYWVPRDSQTAYEVEMLRRFMVYTGANEQDSVLAAEVALSEPKQVIVATKTADNTVAYNGDVESAWDVLNHNFLSSGYTIISRNTSDHSVVLLFDRGEYDEPNEFERLILRKDAMRRDQIVQVDVSGSGENATITISSPEVDSPIDGKTQELLVETIVDALNEA